MEVKDDEVVFRGCSPSDADDFVRFFTMASPRLLALMYGIDTAEPLRPLFILEGNLLSYAHSLVAEVKGEVAGIIGGYTWEEWEREHVRTRSLLIRHLGISYLLRIPLLMMSPFLPGRIGRGEYYPGHLVVYLRFRRKGLGEKLMLEMENDAREKGAVRIRADAEAVNEASLTMFRKLGYTFWETNTMVVGRKKVAFVKLTKELT